MTRPLALGISLVSLLVSCMSLALADEPPAPLAGVNVARGAEVVLQPAPNYRHCTDPDDAIQLTDGRTTKDYFWTQKGTVGWSSVSYAVITVDLGQIEPIAGVAFTTAAGAAGVTWPCAIQVLTSDDGKVFYNAGDLVALDRNAHGPLPEGYAIRRLVTGQLSTRGRYVRFVAIPPAGGPYLFVDEVEVFRGPETLLSQSPQGKPIENVANLFVQWRSRSALANRFRSDADALESQLRGAALASETRRTELLERLDQVRKAWDPAAVAVDQSFRAVLPLNDLHAELFRIQAALWKAMGQASLVAQAICPWDPLDPVAPPADFGGPVEVHTMRGEYRAGAINLYNSADAPMQVQLQIEGLPQPPAPAYVTVYEVDWTDTSRGVPVASALMEVPYNEAGWTIHVPSGLVRQVWLSFHVPRGEDAVTAGVHKGQILLKSEAAQAVVVPVQLHVYPLEFPEKPTLQLGGWSYTNGRGACGVTAENRDAFLKHLQQRYVNAPWATNSVLMKYAFDKDDPSRIELDTEQLDAWLADWPDARCYMVFLAVADYSRASTSGFAGAALGTPEFDRRVATWISAWVRHLGTKGIEPERLSLLIHDEPHEGSDVTALLAWSKAIRAAEPQVRLWLDPTYRTPGQAPQEVFEYSDVLCPNRPMWLSQGKPFAEFFQKQRQQGKELHFYSCSGPARLLDPYAYYRLQAWQCWDAGATGSFFWAFGDNSGASSWNEYLARSGPYTPLFLDSTRVVPAKQMEAIRESVQDYETLLLLRRAITRAEQSGRQGPAVGAAKGVLESATAAVLDAEGASALNWRDAKDRSLADRVRARVLEAITSL